MNSVNYSINDYINKLINATNNIQVKITPAYKYIDGHDFPCLGIRGYFIDSDRNTDCVIINGDPWLIAGTLYSVNGNEIIHLDSLKNTVIRDRAYIELRAQALLTSKTVQIDLGKKYIKDVEFHNVDMSVMTDGYIIATLYTAE